MMPAQLSILIVNWRSKDFLRRCLVTVRETCTDLVTQIVVVDGGSFDGCGEMLAAEFPAVEFVQSPENVGFGRSNNLGFAQVIGEAVLLLNPDTELKPRAVQRLLDELNARPDAGILGPRLLNADGTLQKSSVMALPTPLNQALRSEFLMHLLPNSRLWGAGEAFRATEPVVVEAVSGACMLVRSEVFRRLEGFRPDYFMYAEDMDLCFRVRRLGLAVYHVPQAEVLHHGGGSSRTQVSQFSLQMMRVANDTYMRLNHGRATARNYRALQALSALTRMLLVLPACLLGRGARRTQAWMTWNSWRLVLKWSCGLQR